ncbi:MAG: hypothetical protein E4G98_01970 [Promethearchaeota archaeon]|nr:MAG: hypothetical protein E4G98_01970 [Candidatus Lokiarchaeota archaeon]
MDRHNFSFFGQKSALFLDSGSLNEPSIYIRMIKRLPSGIWERPSKKEGKSLKFNLLEMAEILLVLQTPNSSWSTVHRFHQQQSSIKFDHKEATLQMFTTGYSKFFNKSELKVLCDLLTHIYQEKIQFATGNNEKYNERNKYNEMNSDDITEKNNECIIEENTKINTIGSNESHNSAPILVHQGNNLQTPNKIGKESNQRRDHHINPITQSGKKEVLGSNIPQIPADAHNHPSEWLQALQKDADYCLLPGEVVVKREKALSYAIAGKGQIWIPVSQVKPNAEYTNTNLWVKEWFLKIKLDDIFAL